jgi:hypothetical protein
MATAKAVGITLLDATPRTLQESGSYGGKLRVVSDTIALVTTNTDVDGDAWVMCEVPSNAKIRKITMYNDVVDAHATPTLDCNLGVYNGPTKFTSSAGTAYAADGIIDEDAYATALASTTSAFLGVANITGLDLTYEVRDINVVANYVWEDAGLPEDPNVKLRLTFTVATNVAATHQDGDVTLVVEYMVE